jgi:hypothetical protein
MKIPGPNATAVCSRCKEIIRFTELPRTLFNEHGAPITTFTFKWCSVFGGSVCSKVETGSLVGIAHTPSTLKEISEQLEEVLRANA